MQYEDAYIYSMRGRTFFLLFFTAEYQQCAAHIYRHTQHTAEYQQHTYIVWGGGLFFPPAPLQIRTAVVPKSLVITTAVLIWYESCPYLQGGKKKKQLSYLKASWLRCRSRSSSLRLHVYVCRSMRTHIGSSKEAAVVKRQVEELLVAPACVRM